MQYRKTFILIILALSIGGYSISNSRGNYLKDSLKEFSNLELQLSNGSHHPAFLIQNKDNKIKYIIFML